MLTNTLFVIILLCFLSDFSHGQSDEVFFRNDYTYIEAVNSSYKIHTKQKTWFEARRECAQEGASLFYPENDNEQKAVMSFRKSTTPDIEWVFVGISDLMSEGEFETIDGKSVSEVYNNWNSDEPNDSNRDEDCVEQNKAGKMNDCKCYKKHSFICKKSHTLSLERNNSHNKVDKQRDEEIFWKDYTYIESVNSFYKIQRTSRTWLDAKRECAQEGARLFYPENDEEQNAVISFRKRTHADIEWMFLGISDLTSEGEFETFDGKPVSEVYNNWLSDEPNDYDGNEDCVEQDKAGKVNDCKCSEKLSFICKKSHPLSIERNKCFNIDGQSDEDIFQNEYTYIKSVNSSYKIHMKQKTWFEARRECAQEGASLFYPENDNEQKAVMSFRKSTNPDIEWVFVGISDLMSEGEFETIDGKPVSEVYNNWLSDEPNDYDGNEDCVEQNKAGKMNDCKCYNRLSFICKKSRPLSLERKNSYNIDGQRYKESLRNDYTYIEAVNSSFKIHTTQKTWFDAKQECAKEGASLFYPENDDELKVVMSFRHRTQPDIKSMFVGISDIMTEGVFETIDGKAVSEVYNNWKLDESNDNKEDEDCVEQDNAGKMNNCKCSEKFSFICKKRRPLSLQRNISYNIDKEFFRNDYTYIEAVNSFYKIHTTQQTWFDAKRECAQEGASLFYPENGDEQNAVMSFRNRTQPNIKWVFLGISDLMTEGVFETIDGKSVSEVYNNWNSDEPNDANGNEDCVKQDNTGNMNDCKCSVKFSFICKKSLPLNRNSNCNIDYSFNKDIGKCYKLHNTPLKWTGAYTACRAEQSHLAVINSRLEADYLAKLTESTSKQIIGGNYQLFRGIYHLGFHYRFKEGWQTVRGKLFTVDDDVWWDNQRPIIDERDQCGSMFYNGRLNSIDCDTKSFFICEHEAVSSTLSTDFLNKS